MVVVRVGVGVGVVVVVVVVVEVAVIVVVVVVVVLRLVPKILHDFEHLHGFSAALNFNIADARARRGACANALNPA